VSTVAATRVPALVQDAIDHGLTPERDSNMFVLPPDERRWDPFLILVEDWFSTPKFDWHPHRGFQTLTFVLDGRLEHKDNAGGYGVLAPGDAQYMAAGRYALHAELPYRLEPVHTLQLWINLPAALKLTDTSYRDLRAADAAAIREPGVEARLHVGRVRDARGADPADFHVPFTLVDIALEPGARFVHELPGDHAAALYVVAGAVRAGGEPVRARQTAWFEAGEAGTTALALEAEAGSRVIVYSGEPIDEPVVFGGPFVMNTEDEIRQAYADFRAGRFGPIPGS
jgi:redox-sensitive bicupin YhaK (pirin superfamily)